MKINLIGDIMLDEYEFYTSTRISPEAPVPVLTGFKDKKIKLGGAANLAACLSTLGYQINLYGVCSKVGFEEYKHLVQKENINIDHLLVDETIQTTRKKRMIVSGKQICRVDEETILTKSHSKEFLKRVKENIDLKYPILLSDYAKGTSDIYLDKKIRSVMKSRYIDPKYPNWDRYSGSEYLKANEKEYNESLELSGCVNASELIEKYKIKNLIVTMGNKGSKLTSINEEHRINGIAVEVADVTGAGDCFMAAFVWAIEFGYQIKSALLFANAAAAVSVKYLGVFRPDFYQILASLEHKLVLEESTTDSKKIRENNTLLLGGCFDCLHAGHLYLFKKAIELSSEIIIAINTDESVSSLKGNKRPIQKLKDRISAIEKLGFAKQIIPFSGLTPINVIKEIKPKTFLKGGDYSGHEKFEDFIFCRENNIKIETINLKKGFSTTNLIDSGKINTL